LRAAFFAKALLSGLGVFCVAGCVKVPQRDGIAAVDVNAVIRRIKCDLNNIVLEKAYKILENEVLPERRQPFLFLRSWAAKVHLTLAIDDSAQINPGASYTAPLHTVNNVAQTFTLGVGGNATTEAIRQEDVEFLLSFKDIDAENNKRTMQSPLYHYCQPEPGLLLESDLGLDQLIDAALKPVETGILKPGNNYGPSAGAPPAIPKADLSKLAVEKRPVDPKFIPVESIKTLGSLSVKLNQFSQKLTGALKIDPDVAEMTGPELKEKNPADKDKAEKVKKLLANSAEAASIETKTQAIINNIVKPRYTIAQGSLDSSCITPVSEAQFEALAQSANVSAFVIETDKAAETVSEQQDGKPIDDAKIDKALADSVKGLNKVHTARDSVIAATNLMADKMGDCAKATTELKKAKKKEGPAVFDPVSTISETVNFYVTFSGNVTPTWKLVRVTAPTAATFVSGMRKDTNTLILTMGRPVPGANGTVASPAMDNQILYSILGQAIPKQ
jgi:hypothetical protein